MGRSELFNALVNAVNGASKNALDIPKAVKAPVLILLNGRSLRVFVVEDNLVNQKVATRMLENMGHKVQLAGDGQAAVSTYRPALFDIILMDVSMPIMDGFEATQAIRARERIEGGHIPIFALTAHAMSGDKERCLAGGFDGYITKPLRRDDLARALEENPSLDKIAPGQIESEPLREHAEVPAIA